MASHGDSPIDIHLTVSAGPRSDPGEPLLVRVIGDLDLAAVARFEAQLSAVVAQAPGVDLVIDLSRLSFLDSSGAATLVRVAKAATAERGQVALREVPGAARRALEFVLTLDGEAAPTGFVFRTGERSSDSP